MQTMIDQLPVLTRYYTKLDLRNNYCVVSFNMGWQIIVFYPERKYTLMGTAHVCQIRADDDLSTCFYDGKVLLMEQP